MTYKELANVILGNPEQWDNAVIILDDYEEKYHPSSGYDYTVGETCYFDCNWDTLKDGHLIICF